MKRSLIWLRLQLPGEGRTPLVPGEDEIVSHAAANPGAIGFTDHSRVTGEVKALGEVKQ